MDVAWSPILKSSGWMSAGLKFISRCNDVKFLEATVTCYGLASISSLHISNLLVESNYSEVIHLLNDAVVDIFEFSYVVKRPRVEIGVKMHWRIM